MAKEMRKVLVEQEVTTCDRCKSHRNVGGPYVFSMSAISDPLRWSGYLCDKCHALVMRTLEAPIRRKRKAVEPTQ